GIYSILGLLRYYGKQLKIDYSLTPEQALFKLMKVATKYGRGEPLSWFGEGSDAFGLCWMPKIDEYGSTSVEGGIDIHFNDVYKKNIIFEEKFIKFIGEKYIIEYIKESNRIENNFEVGSEFYERNVEVRPKKKKDVQKKNLVILTLLGIKKTIESIKKNDILIIPDREILVKNPSFALLVEKTEQENVYHRLGLVELDSDKLKVERNSEEVIIGSKFYTEIFNVIEVPPKYSLF
ncbi:MAG: hypothetical protein I3273_06775, partial [Candidatus Moeniiplasma glomeromycotorum]|nr:hypothetical protein [Candidatus Moeniiplasma glomeromycotorum]